MKSGLTEKDRAELIAILNAAEPYDKDDPELNTLDGDMDDDRWAATVAKDILEEDDKIKAANKD